MTAQQVTVWELRCDNCNELLEDAEYGGSVVAESVERIREIGENWEWTQQDGETDLCPTCTCARLGHVRRVAASGAYVYCERCDETLLDSVTAEPKAEYL